MIRAQALLLAAALCATTAFAQTSAAPATAPANAPTTGPTTEQGLAALHAHQPQQALDIFEQVLRANPNDAAANLLAASAALDLYKGDLAVQYASKARQLDPANWKIHTTLVVAYAEAGKTAQRDQERAILHKLHDDPHASDAMQTSGFLLDLFPVGQYHVEAIEFFHPVGSFHIYYRFIVHNAAGKPLWQIDAESNDFDEASWAKAYPQRAAAGERQFQLVGQGNESETDYGMFSGKPDYDKFRALVVSALQAQTTPFPGEK
jgi:tetratricopeptide (TPR) repeat protein